MNGGREKALSFVKINGPVLPVQIAKEIGSDLIMSGAILSELVSRKEIMITNVKRGGSPFYYAKGQEVKLQQLDEFLNQREKEAYDLLKEKKVLRDNAIEPVERVALRAIKDYAIPLDVESNGNIERFWKWYLLENGEVKDLVGKLLNDGKEAKKIIEKPKEILEKVPSKEDKQPILKKDVEEKRIEKLEAEIVKVKQEVLVKKKEIPKGEFYNIINEYFRQKAIHIESSEIIRKEREINYIGEVQSAIGKLRYFIKVRNKKNLNEGDLSLAYNEGQQLKLPVLYLSTGELTKKAKDYAEKNWKGQLIFRKLE